MTDAPDLSAEAAEELRGQLICQCEDVYRHRNLHSPDCLYHLEPNLDVLVNEITRLRAEIARLRKALRFYANPDVYKPHPNGPAFDDRDLSFFARAALKEPEHD